MRMTIVAKRIGLVAIACIAIGLWRLEGETNGLRIDHTVEGTIPVTIFRAADAPSGPVVIIAHGFAGSQQLMLPFATTLARAGFTAITFDQPGHGRNPAPLRGGVADNDEASQTLLAALRDIIRFAHTLPEGTGKLALLGHSMASDIVVRAAQADDTIAATIAVSAFSPGVTATSPSNLLIIDGALEPPMLLDEATREIGLAAGGHAQPRTTYGNFTDGTARRLSLSGSVEHIGVLYSRQSLDEAVSWLCATFNRPDPGFRDDRPTWLGVLDTGLILLAWPLSRLLPRASTPESGANLRWRHLLPLLLAPALLTPLILWKLPSGFLPILLGDYLTLHFGLYGILTLILLALTRHTPSFTPTWRTIWPGLAVAAYCIAVIGLPIDRYADNFTPIPQQLPLMAAVLCGTLPYFLTESWLTAGTPRPPYAALATTTAFVISLAIAVALNLHRLFFLIIIIPVIVIFLTIFRLFAAWTTRQTGHPLAGGLALALAFAWAIAVTFPRVG